MNALSITYRTATVHDLPALAALRWAFRAEDGEEPIQALAEFTQSFIDFVTAGIAAGAWTYWIGEDGAEIVAQMAVHIVRSVPRPVRLDDRWGYLTDVYVRPAYRNAGVGTALLARVRRWAEAQELEFLLVWPSDASLTFYERAGFEPTGSALQLTLRSFEGR